MSKSWAAFRIASLSVRYRRMIAASVWEVKRVLQKRRVSISVTTGLGYSRLGRAGDSLIDGDVGVERSKISESEGGRVRQQTVQSMLERNEMFFDEDGQSSTHCLSGAASRCPRMLRTVINNDCSPVSISARRSSIAARRVSFIRNQPRSPSSFSSRCLLKNSKMSR